MQIRARAKARIDLPFLGELFERGRIGFVAVMLKERTLIPCDPEHLEITLHLVDPALFGSLAVEVLDAQDHSPAL